MADQTHPARTTVFVLVFVAVLVGGLAKEVLCVELLWRELQRRTAVDDGVCQPGIVQAHRRADEVIETRVCVIDAQKRATWHVLRENPPPPRRQ